MKKITLIIIFILLAGLCKAQFTMEHFYPEKVFVTRFKNAENPAEKIDAAGELAMYHTMYCRDSIRNIYIRKAYEIAAATQDPAYMVKAKFWDTYVHVNSISYDETEYVINAANELLSYSENYHFPKYKIAAYLFLSNVNVIKTNYIEAEKNAIAASTWLENIQDDSLKVEVYSTLAQVYNSEKDGINASRYLLKLHDYSEQENNEAIHMQALRALSTVYFAIGEFLKGIECCKEEYRYFANKKMIYAQTGVIGELYNIYLFTDDTEMRDYYGERFRKLQDSLGIVNVQTYWHAFYRWNRDWTLPSEQLIKMMKSNFGNKYFWPKAKKYYDIGFVYLIIRKLDSAEYYFNKAKLYGVEKLCKGVNNFTYDCGVLLLWKKQFPQAIEVFTKMKAKAKENRDINNYNTSLQGMIECYEGMNDFKTAYALQREYHHISDSLDKLNNKQVITMMEFDKDKEIGDRKQKENETKLVHSHNIQYMGMALGALAIILVLILLGIINAKPWVIRAMSFFSFIFIFEFIILILDNRIHELTGGEPWKIMLIKVIVIGLLLPLHHFVEKKVAHNLIHKNISPGKWIKTIWGDRIQKPED
jgi:hypothetical protein